MYECTNVGMSAQYDFVCVFYVFVSSQATWVCICKCVCVLAPHILYRWPEATASPASRKTAHEKSMQLYLSLCAVVHRNREGNQRDISTSFLLFSFWQPFPLTHFHSFSSLPSVISLLGLGVSAMIPAEIADNWNSPVSYSPVSVGYKSRDHLHPKHRITW